MIRPQSAVFFLEEDSSLMEGSKPLMLEAVLFCPILRWVSKQLLADGIQRFFVVVGPRFAQEARGCFPPEAEVTVSEQQADLMAFLNSPDPVLVLPRAALPMAEAGPGFAYAAPGYELQESWKEKMTNNVTAAELVPGWLPVFGLETIGELELLLRDRIVKVHIQNGVRILNSVQRLYRSPGAYRPGHCDTARHYPAGREPGGAGLHHRPQRGGGQLPPGRWRRGQCLPDL